jgi:hypothetical protein
MALPGMMESIKPIDLPSRTLFSHAGAGPGRAAVVLSYVERGVIDIS